MTELFENIMKLTSLPAWEAETACCYSSAFPNNGVSLHLLLVTKKAA